MNFTSHEIHLNSQSTSIWVLIKIIALFRSGDFNWSSSLLSLPIEIRYQRYNTQLKEELYRFNCFKKFLFPNPPFWWKRPWQLKNSVHIRPRSNQPIFFGKTSDSEFKRSLDLIDTYLWKIIRMICSVLFGGQ